MVWLPKVEENAKLDVFKALVGCKSDGQRQIQNHTAEDFALQHGFEYYETSAKLNAGIDVMFDDIVR